MATSSIFTEVRLKDRRKLLKLVRALERSKSSVEPDVHMSRPYSDMSKEQMQKLFGDHDGRIQSSKT